VPVDSIRQTGLTGVATLECCRSANHRQRISPDWR